MIQAYDTLVLDLDGKVKQFMADVSKLSEKFDGAGILGDLTALVINNDSSYYNLNEYIAQLEFNVDELIADNLTSEEEEKLLNLANLAYGMAEVMAVKIDTLKLFPVKAEGEDDYIHYSLSGVTNSGELILELVKE